MTHMYFSARAAYRTAISAAQILVCYHYGLDIEDYLHSVVCWCGVGRPCPGVSALLVSGFVRWINIARHLGQHLPLGVCGWGLTSVVILAWFGLTTGFLLGPADDRMVSPSHLPQKQIFLMVTCAVNIQGGLGKGTLGYKVICTIGDCCE